MVRLALVREKELPSLTDRSLLIREVPLIADTSDTSGRIAVRVFGGPTALFDYGGLRFLTDPTFDAPGEYRVPGGLLTKTAPAAGGPDGLGRVDVVLLSHDEHPDNLDNSGRALLADVPLTLTTPGGGQRLGDKARGLADWESIRLDRPGGGTVTVTGVPAIHGPLARDQVEPITGQVVGFVLTGDGLPTVYVSGDNASLDLVREIADRFGPVDTAILFAGAPRFDELFDGALIVLDSAQAAEAAEILGARQVVPVHYNSWAHFTEGRAELVATFTAAGLIDRLDLGDQG
jgi:L-ascorbate metabolism protein UlaG (beta-lactamase superfamily)